MDKHERWNERYAKKELTWSSGPNALLESLVAERPAGKALDIATGEGRNALWLASRGWGVDAIDFSSVGIEKGKSMAAERNLEVNWITADVCQRVFARAEYDLVAVVFLHTTTVGGRSSQDTPTNYVSGNEVQDIHALSGCAAYRFPETRHVLERGCPHDH